MVCDVWFFDLRRLNVLWVGSFLVVLTLFVSLVGGCGGNDLSVIELPAGGDAVYPDIRDESQVVKADWDTWVYDAPTREDVEVLAEKIGEKGEVEEYEKGWRSGELFVATNGAWFYKKEPKNAECEQLTDPDERLNYDCGTVTGVDEQGIRQLVETIFGDDTEVQISPAVVGYVVNINYRAGGELSGWSGTLRYQNGGWDASGWIGAAERLDYPTVPSDGAWGTGVAVAPTPAGCPETIVLLSAQIVNIPVQDVGGTRWTLPGYRFEAEDGRFWEVVAVKETLVAGGWRSGSCLPA